MNLETWIATATENLVPKAVQKVREDITMHVENAVQQYQLERHDELEALELAVRDLGDAKVAARGFEKAYLTKKELDNFHKLKLRALNYIWFGICQLGCAIWFLHLNLKSSKLSWSGAIFSLTISIYTFLDFIMAKKLPLKSYTISRIILTSVLYLAFIPFSIRQYVEAKSINQEFTKLNMSNVGSENTWFFPILIGFCIIWGFFVLRRDHLKWRKMRFL